MIFWHSWIYRLDLITITITGRYSARKTSVSLKSSPFQTTYAAKLDGVQDHMLARLLQVRRLPGEDVDRYYCRRRQLCRQLAAQTGKWSTEWAQASCLWGSHVQRGHDPGSWSTPIYQWHGRDWLQAQRLRASRAGRLGTRSISGRPAVRWFEGLEAAKQRLETL